MYLKSFIEMCIIPLHPHLLCHRHHFVAAVGGHSAATGGVETLPDCVPPDKVDTGMGAVLYIVDVGMIA